MTQKQTYTFVKWQSRLKTYAKKHPQNFKIENQTK